MSTYYGKLTPSQGQKTRTAAGSTSSGIGAELSDGEHMIKLFLKNNKLTISVFKRTDTDLYNYEDSVASRTFTLKDLTQMIGGSQ